MCEPFTSGLGGDNPESYMGWAVRAPSSLHAVLSARKKVDKLLAKPSKTLSPSCSYKVEDVNPAMFEAMKKVLAAIHPVAVIADEMKSKVVKGRKPNPEAAARRTAELDKKDMKTCGCCFRSIARLATTGKIADHGFTLNKYFGGGRAGSCPGMMFPPLEVSDEGLHYMIASIEKHLVLVTEVLAEAPTLTELVVARWRKSEVVSKGSYEWDNAYRSHVRNLEWSKKS